MSYQVLESAADEFLECQARVPDVEREREIEIEIEKKMSPSADGCLSKPATDGT